jgi:small-conductance mechanosensitive channel
MAPFFTGVNNETEGKVLDVGLLAAKIRTIEGQEVTIPNSVLVGTSTRNYTGLGQPDGMSISSTVTIGYDAPWRQVRALLELVADRTPNISKARNRVRPEFRHPGCLQRIWRADVIQPNTSVIVLREKWHAKPSRPLLRIPRKAEETNSSDK